jgi:hypothetical protein
VDGRYLLPMALRLAAREPDRVGAARYLLSAKDYLFGVLTGEVLTDPSTATGTGCYDPADGTWIAEAPRVRYGRTLPAHSALWPASRSSSAARTPHSARSASA